MLVDVVMIVIEHVVIVIISMITIRINRMIQINPHYISYLIS